MPSPVSSFLLLDSIHHQTAPIYCAHPSWEITFFLSFLHLAIYLLLNLLFKDLVYPRMLGNLVLPRCGASLQMLEYDHLMNGEGAGKTETLLFYSQMKNCRNAMFAHDILRLSGTVIICTFIFCLCLLLFLYLFPALGKQVVEVMLPNMYCTKLENLKVQKQ
eukprot:gnl/MRDRNA2_/MRDRNA2_17029_c0_seq1.p1 gnl/MRDRNA2_/MRDRNA2_17029_c0~~gnl/MRDRNA2_/MRDRNA2_17029_c0_seq1.p1  ORF type:complete len:162 (-),score=8.31 gnl/MRDRNA2_/MRDRNA2_17029_c0_seq1:387-872(-)